MKKKISLLLCMIAAVLCFTACGKAESTPYDEEELVQVADFLIGYCAEADEMAFEQWKEMSEFGIDLQLTEAGLPFEAESFLSVLDSWQAGIAECGSYIEHGDYSFKMTNGKIEVSADAKFENRDAVISFMFNSESKLESMDVSVNMETGEISRKIERGKHTTRHAQLFALGENTFICDTPGFTSLSIGDMEKEELCGYYAEFAPCAQNCRFRGCSHIREPSCGVRQALAEGRISRVRYDNYVLLYEELKSRRKY